MGAAKGRVRSSIARVPQVRFLNPGLVVVEGRLKKIEPGHSAEGPRDPGLSCPPPQ
jgi:hypothetical protein